MPAESRQLPPHVGRLIERFLDEYRKSIIASRSASDLATTFYLLDIKVRSAVEESDGVVLDATSKLFGPLPAETKQDKDELTKKLLGASAEFGAWLDKHHLAIAIIVRFCGADGEHILLLREFSKQSFQERCPDCAALACGPNDTPS